MARRITDFDGTVNPITVTDPYGTIKDDPGGTKVNGKSNNDMQVFFQRLMALGGVTPNGFPDNTVNGFQLYEALSGVIGNWGVIAVSMAVNRVGAGTLTAGSFAYKKYKQAGKSLIVQMTYTGATIGGVVSSVTIIPISASYPFNNTWANIGCCQMSAVINQNVPAIVTLKDNAGTPYFEITPENGGNFPTGAMDFNFFAEAEIV